MNTVSVYVSYYQRYWRVGNEVIRVNQISDILNTVKLGSDWPEDFPEKVNISMNPNQISLTVIG